MKCEKGHWVSFPAKGERPVNLGKKKIKYMTVSQGLQQGILSHFLLTALSFVTSAFLQVR